jgi:hypothetical protein
MIWVGFELLSPMFYGIFKAIRRIERLTKIQRIHDDLLHARGGVGTCRVLKRGMGNVNRLDFDTLSQEGGRDYI